jgi:putative ABC transport system ATP-binding protein
LHLAPGTLTAVVGPSGAGKSTLLFLLAGLELPSTGSLRWGGFDWSTLSGMGRDRWRRTRIGLVFQDFQLVPDLTAIENVLLPLTFTRWSIPRSDRTRAATLLERLGIVRPDARAASLSRGEMQRVALARALVTRPPVLLADEPTASLDAVREAEVADLLLETVRDEGTTAVVSTHQPLLRERADRLWRLDHGQLTEEAP